MTTSMKLPIDSLSEALRRTVDPARIVVSGSGPSAPRHFRPVLTTDEGFVMFERFTEGARRVVVLAHEEARALGHEWIRAEHLLIGVARDEDGLGGTVLLSSGVTAGDLRSAVVGLAGRGEARWGGHLAFTPNARDALANAHGAAIQHGDFVSSGHILLSLLAEKEGAPAEILSRAGIDVEEIGRRTAAVTGSPETVPVTARTTSASDAALAVANQKAQVIAQRLGVATRAKDAALDAGDLAGATAARAEEKELLAERAALIEDLRAPEDGPHQ
ncbi:Clp protease N-terminal domain-containing protein [Parafrankia sp. EUN1f]|uniref:Clp protease N-terminal domain-containing protein n=1 Tax=Parafrankia sp. EUN1f TaxID=102897 RepID=UPI0001C4676B|nr:Clp protease N-terminal domain-containing protein [Parafrankia sp. EUN1f]EFC82159.1 Clp domain protein [Parafrankia sp. EUN1f]